MHAHSPRQHRVAHLCYRPLLAPTFLLSLSSASGLAITEIFRRFSCCSSPFTASSGFFSFFADFFSLPMAQMRSRCASHV